MIDLIDSMITRFKKETGLEKFDRDISEKDNVLTIEFTYLLTYLKPVQSGYVSPLKAAEELMTALKGSFQEKRYHNLGTLTLKIIKEQNNVNSPK
jgi:hypothetical protein